MTNSVRKSTFSLIPHHQTTNLLGPISRSNRSGSKYVDCGQLILLNRMVEFEIYVMAKDLIVFRSCQCLLENQDITKEKEEVKMQMFLV